MVLHGSFSDVRSGVDVWIDMYCMVIDSGRSIDWLLCYWSIMLKKPSSRVSIFLNWFEMVNLVVTIDW